MMFWPCLEVNSYNCDTLNPQSVTFAFSLSVLHPRPTKGHPLAIKLITHNPTTQALATNDLATNDTMCDNAAYELF